MTRTLSVRGGDSDILKGPHPPARLDLQTPTGRATRGKPLPRSRSRHGFRARGCPDHAPARLSN